MTEPQYAYDVFISYSSKDRVWVRGQLLERLEAAGLSVCIDYRDFHPGAPSITEMERAVSTSRKTLLILTPHYLASQWAEFESLMLQTLDPVNRARRLIPLLKEQCELPLRISMLTFADFTDSDGLDFAWRRLLTALGAPQLEARSPAPAVEPDRIRAGPAPEILDLRQKLLDRCSMGDLKDVCFILGVDDENYSGGKGDFIRELLADMRRQNRLDQLVQTLREEKPWVLA